MIRSLGALFLYRHRRARSLYSQQDDDSAGVRISIPLVRINTITCKRFLGFAIMMTIGLSRTSQSQMPESDSESESEKSTDSDSDSRIIEFAVVQKCDASAHFAKLVDMAKARHAKATIPVSTRAVIDFGALNFVENTRSGPMEDETKKAIRHALSLGKDSNIWCESFAL